MRAEHHHVKPVLIGLVRIAFEPFQESDGAEIDRIRGQHSDQPEDKQEEDAQLRTDGSDVLFLRRRGAGRDVVRCLGHGMLPCAQEILMNFNTAGYK